MLFIRLHIFECATMLSLSLLFSALNHEQDELVGRGTETVFAEGVVMISTTAAGPELDETAVAENGVISEPLSRESSISAEDAAIAALVRMAAASDVLIPQVWDEVDKLAVSDTRE